MTDKIVIYLFFYGGFLATFCFLVLASFVRRDRVLRGFCYVVAFAGIVYEGGCFATAHGVGQATGGGGDLNKLMAPVGGAFFVALVWCIILGIVRPIERNSDSQNSDKNTSEKKAVNNEKDQDMP